MNRLCSGCGHEATEGEMFTMPVNTSTEWWENLLSLPAYCKRCKPPIVVDVKELSCKRCGHSWYPRQPEVRICPKCKSPYWDKERRRR